MRRLRVTLAVALTFVAPTPAQEAIATLDFFVTTRDGSVPKGLTPGDLSLKIGGRQQRIRSVDLISAESRTRYVALLVDEATLYALEPIVEDAVGRLLASLAPRDMVAFLTTHPSGALIGLTAERAKIVAAAGAMKTGPGVLWPCQRDLLKAIASYANDLPRGRSTSIAVISRGHPEGAATDGSPDVGPCTMRREDLRALEEALSIAQVNLHLFTVSETKRSWGFDTIAANTGGTSGLLSWSSHDGLERALESTRTYYRLAFVLDGATERAQRVELRAPDRTLRIRTSAVFRLKSVRVATGRCCDR
jgi:hypothetical protein